MLGAVVRRAEHSGSMEETSPKGKIGLGSIGLEGVLDIERKKIK